VSSLIVFRNYFEPTPSSATIAEGYQAVTHWRNMATSASRSRRPRLHRHTPGTPTGLLRRYARRGSYGGPSLVVTNLHATESIARAVTTLMSGDAPTALFTAQNLITIESIRTLQHLELDDCVALVGFDDFDTSTCCDQPYRSCHRVPSSWVLSRPNCCFIVLTETRRRLRPTSFPST